MGILLIIALEILSATIIISHKLPSNQNVLGTKLAQAIDVAPDQSAPADNPPADILPSDQPQTPPSDTPTDQSASPQPTLPTTDPFNTYSMENYPNTSPPPSEIPQDQSLQTKTPSPTASPTPPSENTTEQDAAGIQPPADFSASQQTAVVDTDQILTTPDGVSEKNAQDVQKEEGQLSQNTSAQTQASLLLNFTNVKTSQIDASIRSGDFGSANFDANRMGDFIDRIQGIIKNLPASQSLSIKKGADTLCKKSDYLLKSTQLMVPENSEQDLEITRGKCLSINL